MVYDVANRQTAAINPLGNRASTIYDVAGQATASVNPLAARTSTVYNAAGQPLASINTLGKRTTAVYDGAGRQVATISPLTYRTTSVFDAAGQLSALVDQRANRHSFTYDAAGRQTQMIDPLNRRTTSAYDLAGRQTLRLDPRGYRTTYVYDVVDRVTSRRYPNGTRSTFVFDTVGNRTAMRDSSGRCTSTYDVVNRLSQYRTPFTKVLTYVYDDVGMRTRLWENSAGRYTYLYDANNQLTRITNTGSVLTTFAYNAAGQRTELRPGNGTRTSYSYDAAGQTTQIVHRKSNGTSLLQLDYRYDNAGNRQVMIEDSGTARVTWIYDDQNQLLGENRTGTNAYRNTFTYDSAGNRTLKNAGGTRTTSSYDAANQLTYAQAAAGRTTYVFDPAGNQQLELTPAGARTSTTWNYENQPSLYQLSSGSRVTMSYNADNRRTQKQTAASTSTKYIWEPTTDAYFSELNNANTNQKIYTFEPVQYGNLISQRVTANSYIHADALGSTRAISSTGTTVSDTFLYDAWGTEVARTGTTAIVPFRWVGGVGYYYDTETGLVYVRARMYQPTTSRWYSVDLLDYYLSNYHLYVPIGNSPITLIDPTGYDPIIATTFEISIKGQQQKNPKCGLVEGAWRYKFSLIGKMPCDKEGGYFVQKVTVLCSIYKCDNKTKLDEDVFSYWEAWWAPTIKTEKVDTAKFPANNCEIGNYSQDGEVRFYCASDAGSEIKSWSKIPPPNNRKCRTSAGNLPATATEPQFWQRDGASGTMSRHMNMEWHCCKDKNCCYYDGRNDTSIMGYPDNWK